MKLSEHEMALISCLSIFNPENLSPKLVSPADEKDLSLNKEIIFNILRILTREKYPKVHYRRLAAIVSIMSELQAFHMNNMTTWEKFLTFKVSFISIMLVTFSLSVTRICLQHSSPSSMSFFSQSFFSQKLSPWKVSSEKCVNQNESVNLDYKVPFTIDDK